MTRKNIHGSSLTSAIPVAPKRGSPPPMRERCLGACLKSEFVNGMILVFERMNRSNRRRPSQGLTQYFTRVLSARDDSAVQHPADRFACMVLKGAICSAVAVSCTIRPRLAAKPGVIPLARNTGFADASPRRRRTIVPPPGRRTARDTLRPAGRLKCRSNARLRPTPSAQWEQRTLSQGIPT